MHIQQEPSLQDCEVKQNSVLETVHFLPGGQWDSGGGGINIDQAQKGGPGKKIKLRDERGAIMSNFINYGVGLFFFTQIERGARFFVRATKENAPPPW